MIIKVILIQILLISISFERRIEDNSERSKALEENSSNFRYNEDIRSESENQNVNRNIRIEKRSVSVNISSDLTTNSPAFKLLKKGEAESLSLIKAKRNGSQINSKQSYEKIKSAISEFPPDFMSEEFRNKGGFVVHILIFVYFCLGLAVVCDVYFIESLQFISDSLSLPSDIAGATFMAIGTSAPELFTSVIGVFISDNDIGTGTIVGSAVFNLIVIPGSCGFAAYWNLKKMPKISAFPIIRDMIFYILTIITLILCIKDNKVDWVESVTLLSLYVVYIIIMFFNAQFAHLIVEKEDEEDEETPLLKNGKKASIEEDFDTNHLEDYSKIELMKTQNGKYKEIRNGSQTNGKNNVPKVESNIYPNLHQKEEKKIEPEVDTDWTDNCFMQTLLLPFTIVFKITLPKPTKFCFVITFVMSIVWIALLTYVVVWMTTIVGYTIGIPDTVSGITILAAGTSIPELISSYIIVKKAGLADMAICNSIGSNIFDILFCLGLPWLLKSLILMITQGTGFSSLANTSIPIQSAALPLTSLTLLITCFALILTLKLTNWRLGLNVGLICTVVYIGFVVVSTTLELNV